MAEEFTEPTPPESPAGAPVGTPAAGPPPPEGAAPVVPAPPPDLQPAPATPERGHIGVALLLAAVSIVAAIVGARVSFISSEGSGSWQSALRLEVKRSAGAQETVRYLYQDELPLAIDIIRGRLVLHELQSAAATQTGSTRLALEIEASLQTEILRALEPSQDLTKSTYALPSGGVDLGKRLADLRAADPAQFAIDPDASQATGDKSSEKARYMTLSLVPLGFCALLGALAQVLARQRRLLLPCGTVALAIGTVMALGMEFLL